jgi:hypothetical protein
VGDGGEEKQWRVLINEWGRDATHAESSRHHEEQREVRRGKIQHFCTSLERANAIGQADCGVCSGEHARTTALYAAPRDGVPGTLCSCAALSGVRRALAHTPHFLQATSSVQKKQKWPTSCVCMRCSILAGRVWLHLWWQPCVAGLARVCFTRAHSRYATSSRVAVVSTEAAHVMTKAAEHFIGWITTKAMANKDVRDRKKVCLNYHDLPPLLAQNPEQLEFATDL